MYIGVCANYPFVLLRFLMELNFSRQPFEKFSKVKFNENPSTGSRVAPCGLADKRTALTKLIIAFRNFGNAPKNCTFCPHDIQIFFIYIRTNSDFCFM